MKAGIDVDEFAPRLSFFFVSQIDFLEEVAKFRAARRVWARVMKDRFGAKKPESMRLRFHCQTAGVSCTAREPLNNIARTAIEALAAVLGGAQSLHTNGYDEALSIPSEPAMKIALRTQQIIAEETGVVGTIDPLGGSYAIERLTAEIEKGCFDYFAEIDKRGGVITCIEDNFFQLELADAAYDLHRRKEAGERQIVGVTKYRDDSREPARRAAPRRRGGRATPARPAAQDARRTAMQAAVDSGARRDRARREDRREHHARDDRGGEGARDRRRDHQRAAPGVRNVRRDAGLLIAHRVHRDLARAISARRERHRRRSPAALAQLAAHGHVARRRPARRRHRHHRAAGRRQVDARRPADRRLSRRRRDGRGDRGRSVVAVHARRRARRSRAHAAPRRRCRRVHSQHGVARRPAAGSRRRRATRCGSPKRPASTSVIVETVGVGQVELEVVAVADVIVVVTVPALGDGVQTIKAGLTEIADIFVVNMADRPGANAHRGRSQAHGARGRARHSGAADDRAGRHRRRRVARRDRRNARRRRLQRRARGALRSRAPRARRAPCDARSPRSTRPTRAAVLDRAARATKLPATKRSTH